MAKLGTLMCHLCNIAGTESCDESTGHCFCKPWYEGEYCQNCRFTRDFILAPNGTCIPCTCGLRSIYECLQNNLCLKYAGDHVKEAITVSALFLSAVAAITCLSVCVVWRVISRNKHSRPNDHHQYLEDTESGQQSIASRTDPPSIMSLRDYDQRVDNDRKKLLSSMSRDLDNISLISSSTSMHPISPFFTIDDYGHSADSGIEKNDESKREVTGQPEHEKIALENSANDENAGKYSCTKYYFLNVRVDDAEGEL